MTGASQEVAGLLHRDIGKLRSEIAQFPEGLLWRVLPGVSNSAGNLALHLEGNLREYIGRQLGHVPYERNRPFEFSLRDIPKQELLSRLAEIETFIPAIVNSLGEGDLDAQYPEVVLESPMSVRHFLIHLHGHLTYHTGQINYTRRLLASELTQF